MTTGGGGISVKNSALDGNVSTGGGAVVIEGNTGNLKGSTGGGSVTYKGGSSSASAADGGQAHISSPGGDINLADVPGGANVRTGGGNIHIESGRGTVKAITGGGNIFIGSLDGSVDATTGGGNVDVTVVDRGGSSGHDVKITSGKGDITVILPPGLSADFNVDLAFTQNSKKDYQILSDFGLNQQVTEAWDTSQGTARKHIYGKATIGSGQNRIVIKTVNGNVTIRQASQ